MLKIYNSLNLNIINDFLLKIIANIVQVVIKNILVMPYLATIMSVENYGDFITILSIMLLICAVLGNSLTSTRLILEEKYQKSKVIGDFNVLAIIASFCASFITYSFLYFFPKLSNLDIFLISVITMLETFLTYHSGWFILRQAYKQLIIYTVISGFGFIVGLILTSNTNVWQYTYLGGDLLAFLYIIVKSPLIKEKHILSNLLKETLCKYLLLILTTAVASSLVYLDRFILYPLIGAQAVAIYTTACVFGKTYALLSGPLASVILGYFASGRIKMTVHKFLSMNVLIILTLIIFLVCTSFVGSWITGLLYPTLISLALPYILVANASSAIMASSQLLKSVALKYVDTRVVLFMQIMYGLIYGISGYFLSNSNGLIGFAYAALISSILNYMILFLICIYCLKILRGGSLHE